MDRGDRHYEEEENTGSESSAGRPRSQIKPHKGGKIIREEPSNLRELQASHLVVTYFRHLGCFELCKQVERFQHHPELTKIFVANLHDNKVTLARVTFTVSPPIITDTTRIPNV